MSNNDYGVSGGNVWGYKHEEPMTIMRPIVIMRPGLNLFLQVVGSLVFFGIFFSAYYLLPHTAFATGRAILGCNLVILAVSLILFFCSADFFEFLGSKLAKKFTSLRADSSNHEAMDKIATITGKFEIVTFIIIILSLFLGVASNPTREIRQSDDEKMASAYQEEYGYAEVEYPFDLHGNLNNEGTIFVVGLNDEEIEVDVIEYKDQLVLFEDYGQLVQKMKKIDVGTFLEGENNE